jgi:hypothetical protein
MSDERTTELDRLYARQPWGGQRRRIPDAWSPPWRPRGQWWMRPRGRRGLWWAGAAATARAWQRLVRPPRAS